MRITLPQPLADVCTERERELCEILDRGDTPPTSLLDKYRDPPLKAHLVAEVSGKCMYCESNVTHVYYGDVEHIRPKTKFPRERLTVSNLGFVCALCNNAKGDFWDDSTPLLNPYIDDPEAELLALGYSIARRPGRVRARLTIEKLDLNRLALVERRRERIQMLEELADQYVACPPGVIRELLETELLRHAAASGEFAFTVRAYLEAACGLSSS
jgi:5-methylcytosine-specific restriction endonuclease McrA